MVRICHRTHEREAELGSVADDETGFVLPAGEPERWVDAAVRLIGDASLRERMGRAASARMRSRDIRNSFEFFWDYHERAAESAAVVGA